LLKGSIWGLAMLAAFACAPALARARPLLVVEVSEADAAAAARLIELIAQPTERVRMAEASDPLAALAIARSRGFEQAVILDSTNQRVQLLRCRDGTVLTRVVDPSASSAPSYVMAFVAVELIALSAQLEANAPPPPPPPPAPEHSDQRGAGHLGLRAQLRVGGELIWLGAPFAGSARPTIGAGLWLARLPKAPLWLIAELDCALLGSAEMLTPSGRIVWSRSDAALRAGVAYEFGRLAVIGFAQARAALTSVDFLGPGGAASRHFGWGAAAGVEADLRLTDWAVLYASTALDFAAVRSDYRVEGVRVAQDPAQLANVALGLAIFQEFR
jgi:hypothetical protein